MGGRHIILGAQHLKPLNQGDLSKLCGLYSIINAIRLMLYPRRLSRPQLHGIYRHGIEHLAERRQLKRVLSVGMTEGVWLELATVLTDYATLKFGVPLHVEPVLHGAAQRSRLRAIRSIRRAVGEGSALLVCFGGKLNHYTVLAGYTDHRFLLFDSGALRWVEIRCVGLGDASHMLHRIYPGGVSAISRQE